MWVAFTFQTTLIYEYIDLYFFIFRYLIIIGINVRIKFCE